MKWTDEEWEDICDGCGKCCSVLDSCFACPFLDCKTNRCTTYETRFQSQPLCAAVTPESTLQLHKDGVLPDSCAYVRVMKHQEPLPRPVEKAKLISVMLAGIKVVDLYEQAVALKKKANT